MSGEIVSLRRVRKERARDAAAATAAENRRRFGRTKVERAAEEVEVARLARTLDGAKRET